MSGEITSKDGKTWHRACAVEELAEGDMLAVDLGSRQLALYHVEGGFYATDRICTHGRACLTDGMLNDYMVECPLHAGVFDIRTGAGQGRPIVKDLKTYTVTVAGGDVLIDTEE